MVTALRMSLGRSVVMQWPEIWNANHEQFYSGSGSIARTSLNLVNPNLQKVVFSLQLSYVFVSLSSYLPISACLSVSICLSVSVCLPTNLPTYLPACLPSCMPSYRSFCMPVCLCACVQMHLQRLKNRLSINLQAFGTQLDQKFQIPQHGPFLILT